MLTKLPACGVMKGSDIKNRVDSLIDSEILYAGIKELPQIDGVTLNTKGFYVGSDVGGGQFYYDPLRSKADHNGGTVIAPDAIAAWDGTSGDIATLLDWSGAGAGCFVRFFSVVNPLLFGAVGDGSVDDSAAVRASIEAAASWGVKSFSFDSKIYKLSPDLVHSPQGHCLVFDERFNGFTIDCSGSMFVNGNTSAINMAYIAIRPTSGDVENIKVVNPSGSANAVMTRDGNADNTANINSGNFVSLYVCESNGINKVKNCGVVGVASGYRLGKNVVQSDSVEGFFADNIYAEEVSLHAYASFATAFGAISTWPADLNPSATIGAIRGYNTRTLFDLSTVGISKEDTGSASATVHIGNVVGHNIKGRTKIHGYWNAKIGRVSIKNDDFYISDIGEPALDVTNPNIVSLSIESIYTKNYTRAIRFDATKGPVKIGSIEAVDCMQVFLNSCSNLSVDNLVMDGCFAIYQSSDTDRYNLTIGNLNAKNVRREKFVNLLTSAPAEWSSIGAVSTPTYPLEFGSHDGRLEIVSGNCENWGEDSGSAWLIHFWMSANNALKESVGVFSNISWTSPPPVTPSTLIQADGYQRIHLSNVSDVSGVVTGRFFRNTSLNATLFMRDCNNSLSVVEKFDGTLSKSGGYWTWVDTSGSLRISSTKPTDRDVDGSPV